MGMYSQANELCCWLVGPLPIPKTCGERSARSKNPLRSPCASCRLCLPFFSPSWQGSPPECSRIRLLSRFFRTYPLCATVVAKIIVNSCAFDLMLFALTIGHSTNGRLGEVEPFPPFPLLVCLLFSAGKSVSRVGRGEGFSIVFFLSLLLWHSPGWEYFVAHIRHTVEGVLERSKWNFDYQRAVKPTPGVRMVLL